MDLHYVNYQSQSRKDQLEEFSRTATPPSAGSGILYVTIRLLAFVFYERIVNEAQPS